MSFRILLLISTLIVSGWARAKTVSHSRYDKERAVFITEGEAVITVPYSIAGALGTEFENYRLWALNGINGGPDNPRNFMTLMKDLVYFTEPYAGFMLIYDLDLIFPFARTDERLRFKITRFEKDKGLLKSYAVVLDDHSFAISKFDYRMDAEAKGPNATVIKFRTEIKMSSVINVFFNLKKYQENVEWRILKMISNFIEYAQRPFPQVPQPSTIQ